MSTPKEPPVDSQDCPVLQLNSYPPLRKSFLSLYREKQEKMVVERARRNRWVKDSYKIPTKITPLPVGVKIIATASTTKSVDNGPKNDTIDNVLDINNRLLKEKK